MKSFEWKNFLRQHPIFSDLTDRDIEQLLTDQISEEIMCPPGSVILREGEVANSLYLIGAGSVQVVLLKDSGPEVLLSLLRRGEIFGEMALLQQRPRAATVKANEACTLLEINGQEFLQLVREYPDIEFKVLLTLNDRLRHVNEQVLAVQVQAVDEKLNLFNTKLDAELKVFDVSLKAAQTVFEQTKIRTDEVINSAERSQSRLDTTAKTIGLLITIVVTVLGWFGVSKIQDVTKIEQDLKQQVAEVSAFTAEVAKNADEAKKLVEESAALINNFRPTIEKAAQEALLLRLPEALKDGPGSEAIRICEATLQLNDRLLTRRLLGEIERNMVRAENREQYLDLTAKSVVGISKPPEKVAAYTTFLALLILTDHQDYRKTLNEFKAYLKEHKDLHLGGKLDISLLEGAFAEEDQEKRKEFEEVKQLILAT